MAGSPVSDKTKKKPVYDSELDPDDLAHKDASKFPSEMLKLYRERFIADTHAEDAANEAKRKEAKLAAAEFDYNDPKVLEGHLKAAHDIGWESAHEKLAKTIAEKTQTPEARLDLAHKLLEKDLPKSDLKVTLRLPGDEPPATGAVTAPPMIAPAATTGAPNAASAASGGAVAPDEFVGPPAPDVGIVGPPAPDVGIVGPPAPAASPTPTDGAAPGQSFDAANPVDVYNANAALEKSATKDKLAAEESGQAADKLRADVELEKRANELEYSKKLESDLKEIQTKYTERADDQMTHYRAAVQDLAAVNPNPWADRSTGWTIGSALFIGMTQAGLSLSGSNAPNQAISMMEHALSRDLQQHQMLVDSKKSAVTEQGNLLAEMRTIFGDKKVALQAAKVAGWERITAEAERQLASKGPDLLGLQAQKTLSLANAKMKEEKVKLIDQLHLNLDKQAQLEMHERVGMAAAGKNASKELTDTVEHMQSYRGNVPVTNAAEAMRNIDSARKIVGQYPDPDQMPLADYNTLITEMAKVAGGGAATQHMVEELGVKTLRSKFSGMMSKITNESEPAHLGVFIKKAQNYLNELYDSNKKLKHNYVQNAYKAHEKSLTPADRKMLRKQFADELEGMDDTAAVQ